MVLYFSTIIFELNKSHFHVSFVSAEAKEAKAEVSLMSLLSTLEDISAFQYEEEQQETSESHNTPKVPRTKSLEDLGIEVGQGSACHCRRDLRLQFGFLKGD